MCYNIRYTFKYLLKKAVIFRRNRSDKYQGNFFRIVKIGRVIRKIRMVTINNYSENSQ